MKNFEETKEFLWHMIPSLTIASTSNGRRVRKLRTSQLIPCCVFKTSAASSPTPTPKPKEIIETSVPSSSILA